MTRAERLDLPLPARARFAIILFAIFLAASCDEPFKGNAVLSPLPPDAAGLVEDGRAGPPPARDIEEYFKSFRIMHPSFSGKGGRVLYSSNETGVYNVFAESVNGGNRVQLTRSEDDPRFAVAFFPEDGRVLFRGDKGGDQMDRLYVIEKNGGVIDLSGGREVYQKFKGWSGDGKSMYVADNSRDPEVFDLYQWDLESLNPKMVFKNDDSRPYGLGPVSGDDGTLVLSRAEDENYGLIQFYDLESGKITRARARMQGPDKEGKKRSRASFRKKPVNGTPKCFSPDGRYLFYLDGQGREFRYLMRLDLKRGISELAYAFPWDIVDAEVARGRDLLVLTVNWNGVSRFALVKASTGEAADLPGLPELAARSVSVSPDGERLVFLAGGDAVSDRLYEYEIKARRLSVIRDPNNVSLPEVDLVRSRPIRFEARDGVSIPAYLYRPKGAGPSGKAPAMIWVHGGPGFQYKPEYSPEFQFLLGRGYAILALNNRGSIGYGASFFASDYKKHGREPLWDCLDARDHLASLDWIDEKRIGVMGRSYGGFMTLMALAEAPEKFAAGVDFYGVTDWVHCLSNMPGHWKNAEGLLFAKIGHPEADAEYLSRISPVNHLDDIKGPLLVVHGFGDVRVDKKESDELVKSLLARGVKVEYLEYEGEGHRLNRVKNRIDCWSRVADFLDENMGVDPGPE